MRIDASGRVKIGTTSNTPASAGTAGIVFGDNTAGTAKAGVASFAADGSAPLLLTRLTSDGNVLGIADATTTRGLLRVVSSNFAIQGNNNLVFSTGGSNTERMRIDSSGNLLVGGTDTFPHDNAATSGTAIGASGYLSIARSGGISGYFNRMTSDGDILQFRKDGTTVGSIGNAGSNLVIGDGQEVGLRFSAYYDAIYPVNGSSYADANGLIDLGRSGSKFRNAYLSGGVYLGGTGAANKLDDYEEGTWTPTTSSGSWTITTAKYVKIGKIVHCTFFVTATSDISAVDFTGLPFTPEDSAGGGVVVYQNHISGEVISVYVQSGSVWNLRIGSTQYGLGNTKTMRGVFSYTTAS